MDFCIVRDDFFIKVVGSLTLLFLLSAKSHAAPSLFACKRARNASACCQLFAGFSLLSHLSKAFLSLRFQFAPGAPAVSTPEVGTRAWGGRLTKRLFAALLRYTLEQATLPRLFAPFYPFQQFSAFSYLSRAVKWLRPQSLRASESRSSRAVGQA